MRDQRHRPHAALTMAAALALGACAGSDPTPSAVAGPTAMPHTPAPTAAVTASPGDAWLVVSRAGSQDLEVILDSTLEKDYDLPVGIPNDTWGRLLTATPRTDATVIEDLVVQPGFGGPRQTIPGRWRLPSIGLQRIPVGRSLDGSTIVLEEAGVEHGPAGIDRRATRFALLSGRLDREPRVITLVGAFDFDALSPDGSILYVAEQVRDPLVGRYQVRAVDTATGALRPGAIVDKRKLDERMAGYPIDQERGPDGMVMTLYQGREHPFIHALSSVDAWAVCIDLPGSGTAEADAAADWGLGRIGSTDVAINATIGLAVEIDRESLGIRRSVDLRRSSGTAFQLAKFGHGDLGPAGRRVVVLHDGSAIYAAGAGGVVRLDARSLRVDRRSLDGIAVDGLAVTPDGSTVFALTRGGGRIARIDAATGVVERWVGDGGFDLVLGALPW